MIRVPFIKAHYKTGIVASSRTRTALKYVRKLRTIVTMPGFLLENNIWRGASEIVKLYRISSVEKLSIQDIVPTVGANFVVCVSYVVSEGVVKRFKLYEGVGEILYYPLYSGEALGNAYNVEIWNTPATTLHSDGFTYYSNKLIIPACACEDQDIDITLSLNLVECRDVTFDLTDFVPTSGDYYSVADDADGCRLATLVKGTALGSLLLQSVDDLTWHRFYLREVVDPNAPEVTYIDYVIDLNNEAPGELGYFPLMFGGNTYGLKLRNQVDPVTGDTFYSPFVELVITDVPAFPIQLITANNNSTYPITVAQTNEGDYTIAIGQDPVIL